MVLVTRMRSIASAMAMPCGYGLGREIVDLIASVPTSPTMMLPDPMQVKYQVLLSPEKMMSSPTTQPGTSTFLSL